MTKPIAQTFYINEPVGGTDGVVLTAVDIYFASVSSNYGVELQIRTTDNGNPTTDRLPNGQKVLQISDTYASDITYLKNGTSTTISAGSKIITASADATVPTRFEFDTPIFLKSQTSYAFVIIPIGGNPDYTVWTAELGKTDVSLNTPITTNNDTGTLFLSSNDIQFTAIQSEDIKFTIYTADFTVSGGSGTAVYTMFDEENMQYNNLIGSFTPNELLFISDTNYNLAKLRIDSTNTIPFSVGETVYQSNGSANLATGVLYYANGSSLLVTNTVGAFVASSGNTTLYVQGGASGATVNVTSYSQNVIAQSNSTIIVPFTGNGTANIFYANQSIYIGTNNRSSMQVGIVNTVINSTAFSLAGNISFSDTNSLLGQVRGDGLALNGRFSGSVAQNISNKYMSTNFYIWGSTANASSNFSNSYGKYLIGKSSQSSAIINSNYNRSYNAIIPQFADMTSFSTNINYYLTGIQKNNTSDSSPIPVVNNSEKEFYDVERAVKARSDELINNGGSYTTLISAEFTTANNKFSPYIDSISNYSTFTRNYTFQKWQTYGYVLSISNATNSFYVSRNNSGQPVSQSNGSVTVTGNFHYGNSSVMYISNTSGPFQAGYSIYVTGNSTINAYVNSSQKYGEIYNTNLIYPRSRYISKNVVLADKQDAEDLKCFIAAYRPATTDFKVYAKIQHNQDSSAFNNIYWSRMVEISSPALLSSGTNLDDFVELEYDFPTSVFLASNNAQCNTSSANVTVSTTAGIANGNYIYLYNTAANTFIVRMVNYVANNTTLVLTSNPSISTTVSAYADIGIIPGIEDQTGAFLFANNNNIVRYVSNTDVVYDSFKTFAIKIIPVSETSYIIPRAADMRCLALQV